ncbi:peptidase MA family metallohydrolase [Tautonia sociabilis]|uniref:Peptidase MA-like domain-containing protein n=1 Tax=Tautonia sociabilis TaxID=2080755 RepID=A0A432MN69_9BACT|nr:hypothetical protein [Tautonia sociabilis]RUL88862.1 hypothetical protein TsocGM_04430 [Tautonia sociabilis]
MHRPCSPRPAAPALALRLILLLPLAMSTIGRAAPAGDDLEAGREALGRGDGPAAVKLLESALIAAPAAERPAVLDDLRRAYERAASQAEAAGDALRARSYRENLLIINRSRRPAPDPASSPEATPTDSPADTPESPERSEPVPSPVVPPAGQPSPESPAPETIPPPANPRPRPEAPALLSVDPGTPPRSSPAPSRIDREVAPARNAAPADSAPMASPGSEAPTPSPSSPAPATAAEQLRSADAAFRAQKYEEAGAIYARLYRKGELPESHRPVWAYCRFVAVAKRINAQPTSPTEWASIHAEIKEVRALAPELWFSEYLRRLATERSAAVGARPSSFVIRGQSEPDPDGDSSSVPKSSPGGSWQVMETENFRIFHADASLADRIARRAEQARAELFRYWNGAETPAPWSPRCDVYVYPDAAIFSQMTGQPGSSPGFSTMGLSAGKVVARRINLRADRLGLVEAVVPHEVAHVVMADLFPTRQLPRWVDEGLAVLAEPIEAQADRLSSLNTALAEGRVFRSGALMTAPMPDGRYWDLFIAQSTSLTRYLIQLDSPDRLVSFLRASERLGIEPALRQIYGFEGFDDLHARWLSHARRGGGTEAIAARPEGGAAQAR